MKFLITGGAGFIGSNIAKEGLALGYEIRILDNLSTGYIENLEGLDVEFIEGDIRDVSALEKACKGVDGVFHLAASVGNIKSIEQPREDLEINYGGTLNLLEVMRRYKVPLLIYSSTGAGYGEPIRLPIDEHHPFQPDSPYGVSKIAAEKLAISYGKIYDFRVVCLRYFNAYGVNQRYDAYGNVIPIFAIRLLNGQSLTVFGDGQQTRDFIHVKDIARANWLAATSDAAGYYNVATGNSTSIKDLIDTLSEVSGLKPELVFLPPRKGEVIHSIADISKAQNALGFQPEVSLKQGLTDYWFWFSGLKRSK